MDSVISTAKIKELRELTGVGMIDCKKALEAANGDMQEAIDFLRKKGMASAVKKEGRATNEGMLAALEQGDVIAMAEVNAETDFVVRNERFGAFLANILEEIVQKQPADLAAFLAADYSKQSGLSVDQYRSTVVQVIGENIQVKRIAHWKKLPNQSVGIYSHLGGKILVGVVIEGAENVGGLARDIAMHAAAAAPEFLAPEDVPEEIVEREREVARAQVSGKPANIIDKIIEGKLRAYFDGFCLLRQKYIKNDEFTIAQLLEKEGKEQGKPLKIVNFLRWVVGQ